VDGKSIELTGLDRQILETYKGFAEGLADYLGEGYELALHSLEDLDRSVIKIINGDCTGRKEGVPITDLALAMLAKIEERSHSSHVSYFTKSKKGETLKSTTIAIKGEGGRVIGLMCINFYVDTPFSKIIENFAHRGELHEPTARETFASDLDELIDKAVRQASELVNADASIGGTNKNKEIIAHLHKDGIFKLKDAVVRTASLLGISKNTVYLHIRNLG